MDYDWVSSSLSHAFAIPLLVHTISATAATLLFLKYIKHTHI